MAPVPGSADSGPIEGGGRLRPLNAPVPVTVRADDDGVPSAVVVAGGLRRVVRVQERWRIDEGWWWDHGKVSRCYWRLVLDDGRLVSVYRNLEDGSWWSQRT